MPTASFVKDEVEEMFDRIDANGDRRISFDEYCTLMRAMDHTKSRRELQSGFAAIDVDADGEVSFEEFFAWVIR